MATQQFNLRWNNHTNNMLQILADNFEKESLIDVTISCEGKLIKAHKIVLGACSPHLQEIFENHEAPHPVIIMNGIKYDNLKTIVEFMYKGEVKIRESELDSLLDTAEGLQVKGLSHVRSTSRQQSSTPTPPTLSSPSPHNNSIETTKNTTSNNSPSSSSSLRNSPISPSSHTSGNTSEGESKLTPFHLRRKRSKLSSNLKMSKDVNENKYSKKSGVMSSLKENNEEELEEDDSVDLPMIKIEPPFIKDIDEDDEEKERLKESSKESTSDGTNDVKGVSVVESKEKIPRPPNAFMIFANEWRRRLANEHANESNKEISIRLGIMWKNLPIQEKEDYFAASRQANDEHRQKYPDYYYSPKEARMRKRLKIEQQHVNQMISAGQYNPLQFVKVYMDEANNKSHNEKR